MAGRGVDQPATGGGLYPVRKSHRRDDGKLSSRAGSFHKVIQPLGQISGDLEIAISHAYRDVRFRISVKIASARREESLVAGNASVAVYLLLSMAAVKGFQPKEAEFL